MTPLALSRRSIASFRTSPCSNFLKKSWFRRALTSSPQCSTQLLPSNSNDFLRYTRDYLNRPDVQSAIHAQMQKGRLWNECSDVLNYDFNHDSMLPLYEYFLNSTSLRVWVYSGNFDSVLPTTGTMNWIARLGRTVLKEWQPWTGDWCPI
jgi:hypothetical protein